MFSTETLPVTVGTQSDPETIQGEVPWFTVAGSERETEPVTTMVPEIVAEPGLRT